MWPSQNLARQAHGRNSWRAVVAGLLALTIASVNAQPKPATAEQCPSTQSILSSDLYGLWTATVEGAPEPATLLLEKHRDFPESFAGAISRDGIKSWVAGDVDEGDFNLEESANGVSISATWAGRIVDNACGREIRGTFKRTADGVQRNFTLRRH